MKIIILMRLLQALGRREKKSIKKKLKKKKAKLPSKFRKSNHS